MNLLKNVLFTIFTPICGICGKQEGTYICKKCLQDLKQKNKILFKVDYYSNQILNHTIEHGYLFNYEGIIREKILQYKFGDKAYLANMFSEFFVKNEKVCGFLKKYDIILSVPMSNKKIAQRGYNQSTLIAKKISSCTNILYQEKVLIKCKENQTQSTLNKKQRLENVKNVYKIQNEQKIKNKNVIIFDDIFTTGATRNGMCKNFNKSRSKNSRNFNNCKRL